MVAALAEIKCKADRCVPVRFRHLSTFSDIYRRCVLLPVLRLVGDCHSYDRTPPAD
jgi:hypothetical protein